MKPLGWIQTITIFGAAGLLLFLCTRVAVPYLVIEQGLDPLFSWFVAAGVGVFMPLLVSAILMLLKEPKFHGESDILKTRLRFRRMNRGDWIWSIGAFLVICLLTVGLRTLLAEIVPGSASLQPPFMVIEPLSPERYWLIGAWIPFWIFNIMGEELLWRGVILPRQELAFGRHAWLANALGWLIFHAAFGWQMMMILLPILFILPFVVQRRENSWVAVLLHAGLNGPGFLMIVLGLI